MDAAAVGFGSAGGDAAEGATAESRAHSAEATGHVGDREVVWTVEKLAED